MIQHDLQSFLTTCYFFLMTKSARCYLLRSIARSVSVVTSHMIAAVSRYVSGRTGVALDDHATQTSFVLKKCPLDF